MHKPFPSTAGGLSQHRHQRGIALAVALILLILVTIIGLAAIRGTTTQQKMTANFSDRQVAFQGAEAGLVAGAQALAAGASDIRNCGQGGITCVANPFNVLASSSPNIKTVSTPGVASDNAAAQPQYVIENMGTYVDPSSSTGFTQSANGQQYGAQGVSITAVYYRITSRSGDPASIGDRAVVILQAMYKQ